MATLLSKGILRAESAGQVHAFVPPVHDFKKPVPRPKAASKNVTAEEAERRKEEKTRKLYESQEVLRKAREEAEVILGKRPGGFRRRQPEKAPKPDMRMAFPGEKSRRRKN